MILLFGCKQKPAVENVKRFTSDSAKIAVDESFQPIVEQERYIFTALYDNVHPRILYAPESNVIYMLLNDSVRVAVISRNLTGEELKNLKSKNLNPMVECFAISAVSIIVNGASNDTTITVSELKKMLNGDTKTDINIVFDNPNSGLVSYLKAFSGNKEFKQKNIYALKSNKEVIKYVAAHRDAIGIVDFSWLNEPDADFAGAVDKVKIVSVCDDQSKTLSKEFFSPSQNTLALKQYPLIRNVYIVNCTSFFGLGMKFEAFLTSERGQRIILKSGLLPDSMPSRDIVIEKKIKL